MAATIGGWTRVWLVCVAISAAAAWFAYGRVLETTEARARAEYSDAADLRKTCDTPTVPNSDDDIFKRFMKDACSSSLSDEQSKSRFRGQMSHAQGNALRFAFKVFLWPVLMIGLAFAVVGWVRTGFRKR